MISRRLKSTKFETNPFSPRSFPTNLKDFGGKSPGGQRSTKLNPPPHIVKNVKNQQIGQFAKEKCLSCRKSSGHPIIVSKPPLDIPDPRSPIRDIIAVMSFFREGLFTLPKIPILPGSRDVLVLVSFSVRGGGGGGVVSKV